MWFSWTESFWMGRLKDHLESMGDYGSERAQGPGGKPCAMQPFGGYRYMPAKTLAKSLAQTALININRKSSLRICVSLPLSVEPLSLSPRLSYLQLPLFLSLPLLPVCERNAAHGFLFTGIPQTYPLGELKLRAEVPQATSASNSVDIMIVWFHDAPAQAHARH